MTELNPPAWLQDGCYTAQGDRSVTANLVCEEGVAHGLNATVTGLNRIVTITDGGAFIEGDSAPGQGMYSVTNIGNTPLAIPAASTSDPRIDLIVARIYDSQYSGTANEWRLEVLPGVPSPIPEAPAVPMDAIPLWSVRSNPGVSNITAGVLTDLREDYVSCSTPPVTTLVQSGRATIVTSYNVIRSTTVAFEEPYSGAPNVVVSANSPSPQGLEVSVQGITSTQFTISAFRRATGSATSTFEWIAHGTV